MRNLFRLSVLALMATFFSSCGYNTLVDLDEGADSAWADVESAYKKRADLVGNLVSTVQGAGDFEKETLEAVTEARSKATSTTVDPSKASPEQMQQYLDNQSGLGGALSRLLLVVERYPELKATDNFKELQAQLEGIENRIDVARNRYNDEVKEYNSYRRQAPQVIYAGLLGFKDKSYFEGEEGNEKAPEVDFDFKNDDE
ncbi:MAG: LemA family protein [Saprospiraceae bacterium]|nr:LemA family protein [Saprospiraceae bacterium]